jgi:hypothetical protein
MRSAGLAFALLLAACTQITSTGVVSDRLFCGLSIPGGGAVSQAELDAFIDEIVEPRFPQGFTVWRAQGQWKGGDEEIVVLEFIHPADPRLDEAVAQIAAEYRRRFRQEAVLRVTTPVRMEIEP